MNPGFVSFGEIMESNEMTQPPPTQSKRMIEDSIMDIAINAGSDISSLVDKSKGTIDFFHTPPVSDIRLFLIIKMRRCLIRR